MSNAPTERLACAALPPPGDACRAPADVTVEAIDAMLPQTQCTRCGYDGCLPYARAIVLGVAAINRCPPGGDALIARLADRLSRPIVALDADCGAQGPRLAARIEPEACIGCTKCIQACPVDAIIGAPKRMHTVLATLCTGCELCVPPCPTDCIRIDRLAPEFAWTSIDATGARARHARRDERTLRERGDDEARLAAKAVGKLRQVVDELARAGDPAHALALARKRDVIEQAMQRARARQAARARSECEAPAPPGTGT